MTDVVLSPITSGYNTSKINDNFDKVESVINTQMVHTVGGNNVMLQDLDMNSNALLNIGVDINNPGSLLTVSAADARYYNVTGDTLTGVMNVNGNTVTGLKVPVGASEAVRKIDLDGETNARVAGDVNLQNQMTGTTPLMASNFSEVAWHGQVVMNSVSIPPFKNAWSFGPTMAIAVGQVVTIGAGSFWTIANGATTGNGTLNPEIPSPLDMGTL